ncbi:hypothetical protein Tco_0962230 [Tanacetum coccineum]
MTATRALVLIQEIADHSQKWHDMESNRGLGGSNSDGISIIINKLNDLGNSIWRRENDVEATKYLIGPSGSYSPLDKRPSLEETIGRYLEESSKRQDRTHKERRNFAEKVKRHIVEEQEKIFLESLEKVPVDTPLIDTLRQTSNYTKSLQEIVSKKTIIKEVSMVKLNARCSLVLQNKLPSKEKDPGSFIIPCIIGSMSVTNALTDLGASISVMPFSMFKRLGLGNPKPVRMLIKMIDKSMQSHKGMIENVLVKIDKFIFLVDFVILDVVEDDKVPIILGRLMLATAHARIDVFGKKISLEAMGQKVMFNANERTPLLSVTSVCAINDLQMEPFGVLLDSEGEIGIRLDDFSRDLENLLDVQVPEFAQNEVSYPPLQPQFFGTGNRIYQLNPYNLQITCRPFKDSTGFEEIMIEGVVWFKIKDDKTIFKCREQFLGLLQRREKGLMSSWLSESFDGTAAVKKLRRSWVPRLHRSWSSMRKAYQDSLNYGVAHTVQLWLAHSTAYIRLGAYKAREILLGGFNVKKTLTPLMFGVIYDNNKSEKRFMAMGEVMKFSSDTLKRVSSSIRQRLIANNFYQISPRLTEEEVADLRRMEYAILNRLNTKV